MKIKIGLYKHKETGQFDVMINQIDNTFKCHNGEFDLVKEFNHIEKSKEDILRNDLRNLKEELKWRFENDLNFVFKQDKTSDYLDDEKINSLRDTLYTFMCKRRELFKVTEFTFSEKDSQ